MNVDGLGHPLVLPLLVPLAGGLAGLLLPRALTPLAGWIAVLASTAAAALAWRIFRHGDTAFDQGGFLALEVDPLSAFVLLAIAGFGVLVALYSVAWMRGRAHQRGYYAGLLWTLAAAFGAVLANDLVLLLACWGFLALTLYLMILVAGPQAAPAARRSLMMVGAADALLVLGTVLVWSQTGSTRMDTGPVPLDGSAMQLAFACFVAAAFAKAGAVPLHTWVPACGAHAHAPVSALLPASIDKLLGIYLLVRVVRQLFEVPAAALELLMLLGAVTILAGVMMALVQHDLKRLLGYHAVSQVGYMVLGIASGSAVGLAGGLFHMLNNAIYKSALFLGAGAIERTAGTTDLDRLGGLARRLPVTFAVCLVASLAISGVPPLNGFASKWMIYQGLVEAGQGAGPVWIVSLAAAMLGSALTLASFVKVLHAGFLCKPSPALTERPVADADWPMLLPMLVLGATCLLFGAFAMAIPLELLILPAAPADFAGVWWSGTATVMMLAATGAGALVYLLALRPGRLRRVETYIGGEHLDEVYIHGETPGRSRHVEVTGVDFYDTLERLPGLGRLYALARRGMFDAYHGGAVVAGYCMRVLSAAHAGFLPTYLIWLVVGLASVIYFVTQYGSAP